jgi:hypothetical protein
MVGRVGRVWGGRPEAGPRVHQKESCTKGISRVWWRALYAPEPIDLARADLLESSQARSARRAPHTRD